MADSSSRETEPLLPSHQNGGAETRGQRRSRKLREAAPYGLVGLIFLVVSVVLLIMLVEPYKVEPPINDPRDSPLSGYLRTDAIMNHLESLYAVALEHNNSRSVTNGYLASADYVQAQLRLAAADFCDVETQEFKVPVWEELAAPELSVTGLGGHKTSAIQYVHKTDYQNFRYNGPSTTLESQKIAVVDGTGCEAKDYKSVKGKIAVIQESIPTCDLWTASYLAQQAGATGILFYNNPKRRTLLWSRIRIVAWKEGDPLIQIPVLSITNSLGNTLIQNKDEILVNLKTTNKVTIESTINVLCTTKNGDPDSTIVLGAHLDSVPEGPGMVDNGSGASSLLEIALVLSRSRYEVRNKAVFAWWGAEEIGLLGSRHYARELVRTGDNTKVAMNMNFDMLASPNYVPFIHDGSTAPKDLVGPSSQIDRLFVEFFTYNHKGFEHTDLSGGSDFLPFLEIGIPSGGLLTGAGEKKTMEQRSKFGGFANSPLDPCYHQSCDTIENVSKEAITLMSRAALYSIAKLVKAKDLREWLAIVPDEK